MHLCNILSSRVLKTIITVNSSLTYFISCFCTLLNQTVLALKQGYSFELLLGLYRHYQTA